MWYNKGRISKEYNKFSKGVDLKSITLSHSEKDLLVTLFKRFGIVESGKINIHYHRGSVVRLEPLLGMYDIK